jgi:hypothetical protein
MQKLNKRLLSTSPVAEETESGKDVRPLYRLFLLKTPSMNHQSKGGHQRSADIYQALIKQHSMSKTYVLKKDFPGADAGTKFHLQGDHYYWKTRTEGDRWMEKKLVENNPEWFEEDTFKVIRLEPAHRVNAGGYYFDTNRPIPKNAFTAVICAIENVLNGGGTMWDAYQ